MLFIGYQISIEEACRLLKVNINPTLGDYEKKEILNSYCKKNHVSISVHLGRYCVILGIKYEELSDVWGNKYAHSSVSSSISRILEISQKIRKDLNTLNVDMSVVTMTYVEGEEYVANDPEPIIINYELD